jgi:hypothetical protein
MKNEKIITNGSFGAQVLIVDGLPGCGKTLLSQLVTTLKRVELLSFSYEAEWICAAASISKIEMNAAQHLINMLFDLKIYNQTMGRDVNFRRHDQSSAYAYPNPGVYFERLFTKGDEAVPGIISKEQPILNLALHNILSYAEPIFKALENRLTYIHVVRHPVFMLEQQALNFKNNIYNPRDFSVYYETKYGAVPYFAGECAKLFINGNHYEKAIIFQKNIITREKNLKFKIDPRQYIQIPFEPFVLNPNPYFKKICTRLNTVQTKHTKSEFVNQKIPRLRILDGIDLPIYRRCGWRPANKSITEIEELNSMKENIYKHLSKSYQLILDELIEQYESDIWSPK